MPEPTREYLISFSQTLGDKADVAVIAIARDWFRGASEADLMQWRQDLAAKLRHHDANFEALSKIDWYESWWQLVAWYVLGECIADHHPEIRGELTNTEFHDVVVDKIRRAAEIDDASRQSLGLGPGDAPPPIKTEEELRTILSRLKGGDPAA